MENKNFRTQCFRVENQDLCLSKEVLATNSPVFEAMLYGDFEEEWIVPRAAVLLDAVESLVIVLEERSCTGIEIERKYLLRELPDLPEEARMIEIEQGWLPGKQLRERLRCTRANGSAEYFRTVKFGQGIQRIELEETTTKHVFDRLWTLTEGCRIHKRRYKVAVGDLEWEVDEFLELGLVLAEVELPNPELQPALPDWLAGYVVTEVTDDARYTNLSLAERTADAAS